MVVVSVRVKRLKKIIAVLAVMVIIASGILIYKQIKTPDKKADSQITLTTHSDIVIYYAKCGWLAGDDEIVHDEITIPGEFNETFLLYNDLQLSQGFDLSRYKGEKVTRIVYEIKNHPDSEHAVGTLLMNGDNLVGADVTLLDTGEYQKFVNNEDAVAG